MKQTELAFHVSLVAVSNSPAAAEHEQKACINLYAHWEMMCHQMEHLNRKILKPSVLQGVMYSWVFKNIYHNWRNPQPPRSVLHETTTQGCTKKIPPLHLEALSLIPPLLPRSCIFQYNVFSGNKLYKTLSISAASLLFNIRAFLFPPFLLNSCHCLLTHQNLAVREERDATALCISSYQCVVFLICFNLWSYLHLSSSKTH